MVTPNRTIKSRLSPRVVVTSVLIAFFTLGFVLLAIWQTNSMITEAKKSGIIVAKTFEPFAQAEREITLNRDGQVSSELREGRYEITVEVPQVGGAPTPYIVLLPLKSQYDAVKIGDRFDVGPYLVPKKK